jgi:hypothetical protein
MADVKVAVGLGRKPGGDAPLVLPGPSVLGDDGADEVERGFSVARWSRGRIFHIGVVPGVTLHYDRRSGVHSKQEVRRSGVSF